MFSKFWACAHLREWWIYLVSLLQPCVPKDPHRLPAHSQDKSGSTSYVSTRKTNKLGICRPFLTSVQSHSHQLCFLDQFPKDCNPRHIHILNLTRKPPGVYEMLHSWSKSFKTVQDWSCSNHQETDDALKEMFSSSRILPRTGTLLKEIFQCCKDPQMELASGNCSWKIYLLGSKVSYPSCEEKLSCPFSTQHDSFVHVYFDISRLRNTTGKFLLKILVTHSRSCNNSTWCNTDHKLIRM